MSQKPDFSQTLGELDAGMLLRKLSDATAKVAMGCIDNNKKGKVVLTLDIDRIGESSQVNVSHKISYIMPTRRGKASEEDTTVTPMHVNKHGHLSVAPDYQSDLFKTSSEEKQHG